jgi:RNase P subunit RPR2
MDKKQSDKIELELKGVLCPICKTPILPYCHPSGIPMANAAEIKRNYFDKIDISNDNIKIECTRCGYIMFFNKETLLN